MDVSATTLRVNSAHAKPQRCVFCPFAFKLALKVNLFLAGEVVFVQDIAKPISGAVVVCSVFCAIMPLRSSAATLALLAGEVVEPFGETNRK